MKRKECKRIIHNGKYIDYLIYNDGRVYSLKSKKFLKPVYGKDNYIQYTLYDANHKRFTKKAHKLVAEYFLRKPKDKNKNVINHKNGDKSKNDFRNLEYCTSLYNTHHACENNLRHSVLDKKTVRKICKDLQKGNIRIGEISKRHNVSVSSVIKIKDGINWKSISKDYDFSNYKFDRSNKGSKNGNSSITEKEALKICKLLKKGKTPTEISKSLGIPRSIIYSINYRKTWVDIYDKVFNS